MKAPSPYLTIDEAAAYLRFEKDGAPNVPAFQSWRARRKQRGFPVRAFSKDGKLLFKQCDLDGALTELGVRRSLRAVK